MPAGDTWSDTVSVNSLSAHSMARDAEGGAASSEATNVDSLDEFARTLSVQDGELPPPPSLQQDDRRASSPFASQASPPPPAGSAEDGEPAGQAQSNGQADDQSNDEKDGPNQQRGEMPPPPARAVKRATPTAERTESDAADLVRQRVSLEGRKGRVNSSSGGSAEQRAATAAQHHPPRSSFEGLRPSSFSASEAGSEQPSGERTLQGLSCMLCTQQSSPPMQHLRCTRHKLCSRGRGGWR